MKILHCADIHLNSALNSRLSAACARQRRAEVAASLERMLAYARKNGVRAVLICGDLFDVKNVDAKSRKYVCDLFGAYEDLRIFLLRGNHDSQIFLDKIPPNVKLFDHAWTRYDLEGVCIYGCENNSLGLNVLDKQKINIVMMHGDVGGDISLRALSGKNIDYLALGHLHSFRMDRLDNRGVYAYSGCLEARGFDETGDKGFVLLDVEDNKVQAQFVKFSMRNVHDISMVLTNQFEKARSLFEQAVEHIAPQDLVRVCFEGELRSDELVDVRVLEVAYKDRFYYLQIEDKTCVAMQIDASEVSLRAAFARIVAASDLQPEQQSRVLRLGLAALKGELEV